MSKNTPAWLKNAVIYELLVRNYSQKGTFDEVRNDLPRLKSLGVDILWLMPIHPIGEMCRKGSMGSPYSVKDHFSINPDLGEEESFKRLVDSVHEIGMKIIIDASFTHCSVDSAIVREHPEWIFRDSEGNFSRNLPGWYDVYGLNFYDTNMWSYLITILMKWIEFDIDGFRCDAPLIIRLEFWQMAREAVSNKNKDAIWLAETISMHIIEEIRSVGFVAHGDPEMHQVFDITYDYDGYEYLDNYFKGKGDLKAYLNHLYIQKTLYPADAIKMRFLENHDTPRIAKIISSKSILKNWTVFYSLLPGANNIHAGQEVGIEKFNEIYEKDPIAWDKGDYEFFEFFKKTINTAKEIKGKCGRFNIEEVLRGVVKITWTGNEGEYLALLNLEDKYGEIDDIGFECEGYDLLSGDYVNIGKKYILDKKPVLIKKNEEV